MAGMKFDTNTPIGIAAGLWLAGQLEGEKIPDFWKNLDPKMKGAALVFAGDWLPKQKFLKNAVKNADMRSGGGAGLQAAGIQTLMEEFGVAGVGQNRLTDDDYLVVAIEGDYDIDVINEDVLGDDEYEDDIDVINEDVLGDDDDYGDDDDDDEDDVIWD